MKKIKSLITPNLLAVLLGTLLGTSTYWICKYFIQQKELQTIEAKLNSLVNEAEQLSNKVVTLKETNTALLHKNDSIQIKIVKVKEQHEKTANIILSNDVESDYDFFTDYINTFRLVRPDYD